MDLSLITARLKAQVSGFSNRVYGAAELAVVLENPERFTKPFACVVWSGDERMDQNLVPGQQARFREAFSVVVVVDNTVETRGETAVAAVEALASDVQDAIVGWAPSASHLPSVYQGSAHGDMNTSALIHEFRFSSEVPGGSIFESSFQVTCELVPGKTVANFSSDAETMIDSHVGASHRLDSDWILDREAIPEDDERYQLTVVLSEIVTSGDVNQTWIKVQARLSIYHHFAPDATERDYTETTLPGMLDDLMAPATWRALAAVRFVEVFPASLDGDVGREG